MKNMKKVIALAASLAAMAVVFCSCAMEQAGTGSAAASGSSGMANGGLTLLFPIILIVIFIFLIIVPNKKRDKKFKEMLASLKVGDTVKTIGGIYGKIVSLKEDLVTIETGPDKCKIVFSKSAIGTVESYDVESEKLSK